MPPRYHHCPCGQATDRAAITAWPFTCPRCGETKAAALDPATEGLTYSRNDLQPLGAGGYQHRAMIEPGEDDA